MEICIFDGWTWARRSSQKGRAVDKNAAIPSSILRAPSEFPPQLMRRVRGAPAYRGLFLASRFAYFLAPLLSRCAFSVLGIYLHIWIGAAAQES